MGDAPLPAISVVIPTYNRAAFLPTMLASVFAQSECPPFEVILVDDASTDDTGSVLAALSHPLTLIRQPQNGGVARARQTGVERARGSILAFHDSDDVMLPGRLAALARYLDDHPAVGAVFSNGTVEDHEGHPCGTVVPDDQARRLDGQRIGIRDVLRDGLPMFLQTALVRREVYERAGGIDTTLVRHADLELSCRLVLTAPVVFLDRPAFRYRLHASNQTRDRLRLREGLADVMRRLRTRHPECVAQCGADWYRRREVKHLRTIAMKHLRRAHLVRAGGAFAQALSVALRPAAHRGLAPDALPTS